MSVIIYWVITETFLEWKVPQNFYKIDINKMSYRESISFNSFFFRSGKNRNEKKILYTAKTEQEAILMSDWSKYDPDKAPIIDHLYEFYEQIGYDRKKKKFIK